MIPSSVQMYSIRNKACVAAILSPSTGDQRHCKPLSSMQACCPFSPLLGNYIQSQTGEMLCDDQRRVSSGPGASLLPQICPYAGLHWLGGREREREHHQNPPSYMKKSPQTYPVVQVCSQGAFMQPKPKQADGDIYVASRPLLPPLGCLASRTAYHPELLFLQPSSAGAQVVWPWTDAIGLMPLMMHQEDAMRGRWDHQPPSPVVSEKLRQR